MLYCSECGTRLVEGALFCSECGRSISENLRTTDTNSLKPSKEMFGKYKKLVLIAGLLLILLLLINKVSNRESIIGQWRFLDSPDNGYAFHSNGTLDYLSFYGTDTFVWEKMDDDYIKIIGPAGSSIEKVFFIDKNNIILRDSDSEYQLEKVTGDNINNKILGQWMYTDQPSSGMIFKEKGTLILLEYDNETEGRWEKIGGNYIKLWVPNYTWTIRVEFISSNNIVIRDSRDEEFLIKVD